jgi:hypothetical protein
MNHTALPDMSIWIPFIWLPLVIGLSVAVRRFRDKPIFPRAPKDPAFVERGASGGFASRCLLVAVTDDAVIVTPTFPFNLMFLPEIYGLELHIPLQNVTRLIRIHAWLASNVQIFYGTGNKRLALTLRDPDRFLKCIRARRPDLKIE